MRRSRPSRAGTGRRRGAAPCRRCVQEISAWANDPDLPAPMGKTMLSIAAVFAEMSGTLSCRFAPSLDGPSIPLDNVTSCESTKPSCVGCARYGKRYESSMFAVYSVGTCIDEDSGAHHRGRQRRVSSAERTRAAGALIPFRASWLKAGRGKRGRFSRPWRQPSVIGANEAGGSRRCASVNQGGTARAFSRPWTG